MRARGPGYEARYVYSMNLDQPCSSANYKIGLDQRRTVFLFVTEAKERSGTLVYRKCRMKSGTN